MIAIRLAEDPEDRPAVRRLQGQEHLLQVSRPLPDGIYVAELNGIVVGFMEVNVDEYFPEIDERGLWVQALAVNPDLHSQGFGSGLLRHAETIARANGHEIIVCQPSCDGDQERRLRFFNSHGFRDASIPEHEPFWMKRLSA